MNQTTLLTNASGASRAWPSLAPLLFVALTVVFGLQLLRMYMIGLGVYLQQIADINTTLIGIIALAPFFTALLAPLVLRFLGRRSALVVTAGGLGITKTAEQFVSSAPVDLALSLLGVVLFLWFIPIYFQSLKGEGGVRGGLWAIAFLLGISADTAIKGVFGTVDLSWEMGAAPDILVVVLAIAQWLLLWRLISEKPTEPVMPSIGRSIPMLSLGPALVLEFLLFQNIGQQTVLTDWPQPAVYTWILASNIAGIVAATALVRWNRLIPWPALVALGVLLVLMVADEQSGILAAFIVFGGQIIIGLILVSIATYSASPSASRSTGGIAAATGTGMLLFSVLLFTYYGSYSIEIFIPRQGLLLIGGGVAALLAVWAGSRALERRAAALPLQWAAPLLALLLLILPLVHFLDWDEPTESAGKGFPIRVMSYNLHQAFDTEGRLSLEALAKVIEGEDPDVVALQEVSRAWLVNGSIDTLVWLSQRLDLSYVWGPATDSVWGNAVLSRFPIRNVQTHTMPNNKDIRINRGFISLDVELGNDAVLNVIATHLHAGTAEGFNRVPQVEAMINFWDGADNTVLMGDLNARPNDPEMVLLGEAGFKDAFTDSGAPGPGYTSESDSPRQRIDYIWISQDMKATDFSIPESRASDHFAIAVTVEK